MKITEKLTNGCDRLSRVYGNMFNVLQEIMQDDERLKQLTPIDYSAIGLYIGKFVEQEINSSVVQLMRQFCGIDMPYNYCKVCRDYRIDADVKYGKKIIRLNEQKDPKHASLLKSIPLGDSYYALKQLKEEDSEGFFDDYPWLNDTIFLEAWRRLFMFRNDVAHIGTVIDVQMLKEHFEFFQRFLRFMPNILDLKRKLAPDDYIESLPLASEDNVKQEQPLIVSSDSGKPYAPKDVAQRYCELRKQNITNDVEAEMDWLEEINGIVAKFNLDAMIFIGSNGKKGMMDCLGNILVPARYDGFGFLPKPLDYPRESVNALRDGKFYLVSLDGSGKELTEGYDCIELAFTHHMYSPYIYTKDGVKAIGFMSITGEEICDCYVDKYFWGLNCIIYQSGDKYGLWQLNVIFLPPIYDNIEMMGDPWNPYLFTLNGVQGLVRNDDGSFMPLSEYKKLDEDEQNETEWDYICEQYEFG